MYNTKFVKINGITDLTDFVHAAQMVDGEVLVKRGRFCVSGASLMGMMSIDTTQGCTIEYPSDATEFDIFLNQYMA